MNHLENLMKYELWLVGLKWGLRVCISDMLGLMEMLLVQNHTLRSKRFDHCFLLLATKYLSRSGITMKIFRKLKNLKCYQKEASAFFLFLFSCISSLTEARLHGMHLAICLLAETTPCEPNRISSLMKSWSYNFSSPPLFSWKMFASHWQHPTVKWPAGGSQETARRCLLVPTCLAHQCEQANWIWQDGSMITKTRGNSTACYCGHGIHLNVLIKGSEPYMHLKPIFVVQLRKSFYFAMLHFLGDLPFLDLATSCGMRYSLREQSKPTFKRNCFGALGGSLS